MSTGTSDQTPPVHIDDGDRPSPASSRGDAGKQVNSVLAALRLLEEVAVTQPIGVSELARRVGMPKSNAQRLLGTLEFAGWVRRTTEAGSRWSLTTRAFTVGGHAAAEHGLRDVARPVMQDLLRATEENIHLTVLDGTQLVTIERLESPHAVRTNLPLGGLAPLHATSPGKAVLACLPTAQLDAMLSEPLTRYTDTTITDRAVLLAELGEIRRRGYATNHGEWREGVAAVGVAVELSPGDPIGAIAVSAPLERMPAEREVAYGRMVVEAATQIARGLGVSRRSP